jgi:deazaflavin-dependent oxidoreductase (nitroreductase family)
MKASVTSVLENSPRLARAIRAVGRLVNPLVLRIAGRPWMPFLGVLHHRGRRTGRPYRTPLGMRLWGGSVVVPRTFGASADWYRNLLNAGWVEAMYLGVRHRVGQPELTNLARVSNAFPSYERLLFKLFGIDDFVVLRPIPVSQGRAHPLR